MALFKNIKRAFGFADPELEEAELEGIDATVTPLRERKAIGTTGHSSESIGGNNNITDNSGANQSTLNPDVAEEAGGTRADVIGRQEGILPSSIFDTVVKIFNESLPGFLGTSVNTDRQCQYLYEALEASMKDYLANLDAEAQRRYNIRWDVERRELESQMESLREKAKREEEETADSKKLQLSAERQKRALSERVHDLEKRIATLEAENEQYILENKSMANKLRLSAVQDKDIEIIREESEEKSRQITALKEEIHKLTDALEQSKAKDNLGDAMLTNLNEKAADAVKMAAEKSEQIDALNGVIESLKGEVSTLQDKLKLDTESHDNIRQEYEALKTKYAATADELSQSIEENSRINNDLLASREKLNKALADLTIVGEIQNQLDVLEEAKLKTDAILRKQKDELMEKDELLRQKDGDLLSKNAVLRQKDETIHRLEDLSDSLRKTIENNLYEQAQSESLLRSEIERLKNLRSSTDVSLQNIPSQEGNTDAVDIQTNSLTKETVSSGKTIPANTFVSLEDELDNLPIIETPTQRKRQRKTASDSKQDVISEKQTEGNALSLEHTDAVTTAEKNVKISAIDESLDNTDWLIATPPPKKSTTEPEQNEFGYKEPPRKTTPENPAQMSLW